MFILWLILGFGVVSGLGSHDGRTRLESKLCNGSSAD